MTSLAMFFSEPERSSFDWNFRLAGHRVRVHPYFWLATFFLGSRNMAGVLVWVAAVFVSILIHEMGHVWAMRRYGGDGDIVLYSFGGFAIPKRYCAWSVKEDVVISAAGPGAGFLLSALILALVYLSVAKRSISPRGVSFPTGTFSWGGERQRCLANS